MTLNCLQFSNTGVGVHVNIHKEGAITILNTQGKGRFFIEKFCLNKNYSWSNLNYPYMKCKSAIRPPKWPPNAPKFCDFLFLYYLPEKQAGGLEC